jgi:hypothetical protein
MLKFERTIFGHVFLPEPDFDRPAPGERVVKPARKKRGERRA